MNTGIKTLTDVKWEPTHWVANPTPEPIAELDDDDNSKKIVNVTPKIGMDVAVRYVQTSTEKWNGGGTITVAFLPNSPQGCSATHRDYVGAGKITNISHNPLRVSVELIA